MSHSEVLAKAQKAKIKFIDLWFSDILGAVKNVTIPVSELKKALVEGVLLHHIEN